jgi:predicted Zn finger-like uncharacterized protein
MILTRCPNCETVFRVTPEQLRIRHGQVRCGSCFATFNALAELTEEALPPGSALPAGEVQSPSTPFATTLEEAPMVSDIPPEAEESSGTSESDTADIEFIDIGVPSKTESSETGIEPATLAAAELPTERETTAEAELEIVEVDSSIHPVVEPEVVDAATPAGPEAEASVSSVDVPAEPLPEPEADRAAEPESAREPSAEAAVMIEPEHRPHHLEAARKPWHWLWWTGAVIALAALMLQAVMHFRTDLAVRYPETRPVLAAICEQVGCDIPLPTKIDLLEIEHSDLVPDEKNAGRLLLSATLRNLATHPQNWPHLELTLTDAHDRALVRRALAPKDYLPAPDAVTAGFPARGEQPILLELRPTDVPAVGYRLYLFFP